MYEIRWNTLPTKILYCQQTAISMHQSANRRECLQLANISHRSGKFVDDSHNIRWLLPEVGTCFCKAFRGMETWPRQSPLRSSRTVSATSETIADLPQSHDKPGRRTILIRCRNCKLRDLLSKYGQELNLGN